MLELQIAAAGLVALLFGLAIFLSPAGEMLVLDL